MSSIEHRRKPRLLVEAIQEHQLIVSRKTLRLAPAVFCFGDAKSDQAGGHLSFACGGRNRVVRGAPFGRLRPWRPGVTDFINEWICWGAGTRECQNLVLGAKTRALLHGVLMSVEYGCSLAVPVLQHRLLLNDKAEVDGITIDQVIDRLLKSIPAL